MKISQEKRLTKYELEEEDQEKGQKNIMRNRRRSSWSKGGMMNQDQIIIKNDLNLAAKKIRRIKNIATGETR